MRTRVQVRNAAFIAKALGMDPVVVLDERDPLRYAVRWAAAELLADEERAAAERAKRK